MTDLFATRSPSLTSPAQDVFAITPSDAVDLAFATRAIRAAGAGNVVLITLAGQQRTCAFAAGETRAIRATRVLASGTTATGLEGMV